MKRTFDVIVASIGILLTLPIYIVIASTIATTSGFPILFRQVRVGKNGVDFKIIKFRTMENLSGSDLGLFQVGELKRVTPIGKILRRTKLDELPQLWNVLVGQMSLVGPRPEVRKWVDAYPERWVCVLSVLPGITDPASIIYKDEEKILCKAKDPEHTYKFIVLPTKLGLYEQYIVERSFIGDLLIIIKTMKAILF